ncbi:hypothetical protein [Thalassotalea hakodatensis]|uniref:hypothetical protein n=1 Tax=Thalassotalea hakodatensis TaxID=3030492 RepID=UPI0025740995|nr:hypothetical protein [Thalassotalea hakodatensis]
MALFEEKMTDINEQTIRKSVNKGLVLGDDKFKSTIVALTGNRVNSGCRGRPRSAIDD